jgi:hypothetical protein
MEIKWESINLGLSFSLNQASALVFLLVLVNKVTAFKQNVAIWSL